MIQNLRNIYKDAEVAILGSGPSVKLYEEKEDIALAVNGAAFLDKKYDIFVAGDKKAPFRDWWLSSDHKSNSVIRIVSSYIAPFDPFLYPDENYRNFIQKDYREFVKFNEYVNFVPNFDPTPPHIFFKFGGFGIGFVNKISPKQTFLYWGGTISAIALQISLILGSKNVHLYGCDINNYSGSNYFYDAGDQKGFLDHGQKEIMQSTIDKIRDLRVRVNVHGNSFVH